MSKNRCILLTTLFILTLPPLYSYGAATDAEQERTGCCARWFPWFTAENIDRFNATLNGVSPFLDALITTSNLDSKQQESLHKYLESVKKVSTLTGAVVEQLEDGSFKVMIKDIPHQIFNSIWQQALIDNFPAFTEESKIFLSVFNSTLPSSEKNSLLPLIGMILRQDNPKTFDILILKESEKQLQLADERGINIGSSLSLPLDEHTLQYIREYLKASEKRRNEEKINEGSRIPDKNFLEDLASSQLMTAYQDLKARNPLDILFKVAEGKKDPVVAIQNLLDSTTLHLTQPTDDLSGAAANTHS